MPATIIASPAAAAAEAVAANWLLDMLRSAAQSVGRLRHRRDGRQFRLPGRGARRGAAQVGWDVEAQGLFGAPPIDRADRRGGARDGFLRAAIPGFGHDRVAAGRDRARARCCPRPSRGRSRRATARPSSSAGGPDQHRRVRSASLRSFRWRRRRAPGCMSTAPSACGRGPALRRRHLAAGVELADSWATDGHKWLQTPYDCGYAIVRDAEAHRRAMTIAASYLPPVGDGERDPTHFVPELSRRARGFATWAMIKHLGRDGIAGMVEQNCRQARLIAERARRRAGHRGAERRGPQSGDPAVRRRRQRGRSPPSRACRPTAWLMPAAQGGAASG